MASFIILCFVHYTTHSLIYNCMKDGIRMIDTLVLNEILFVQLIFLPSTIFCTLVAMCLHIMLPYTVLKLILRAEGALHD